MVSFELNKAVTGRNGGVWPMSLAVLKSHTEARHFYPLLKFNLTDGGSNDALRLLRCIMNEIVERVVKRSGRDVGVDTREKVSNYISLLASTGKTSRQLMRFGDAYLRELFEPDNRYSGC